MGWVGAVDLNQLIATRLVFNIAGVPRASEVSLVGSFFPPHPPHSLACMDGLDVVSSSNAPANDTPSFIHRFRLACDRLKLPLHVGKRVVRASSAPILDAELDGAQGILRHARDKGPVLGVHHFCPSWVVLSAVYLRSWLSPSSVLYLSGSVQ